MPKKLSVFVVSLFLAILTLNGLSGFVTTSQATASSLPVVPSALKSTFMLGLGNQAGNIGWMTSSGAKWDARYQYITGGVNTNSNWKTWNSPAGMFATYYLNDSNNAGYLPVLTYYQLLQSTPASGNNESDKDFSNLNNAATMNAYYGDFKLLMDQARTSGKPVIVQVEPDLMGFMEIRSANPNNLSAAVSSSGYADVAAYPNTVAGFNQALVGLRNKYAPNVLLAYHISPWASTVGDIGSDTSSTFNTQAAAQQTANFYLQTGANYDLLFYDIADRDAALYQSWGNPNKWWDTNNVTYPNFNRFHQFASTITTVTGKRGMLWQVPIGNTIYRSMNNTNNHWQDNKAQYYLNKSGNQHLQDLANSGIIGILFGAGDGSCTTYFDSANDGITNPNPINNNNAWSSYADDDGGYLRLQAQSYYAQGGLSLPSMASTVSTATPTSSPTPPPTNTPMPTSSPTPTPAYIPTPVNLPPSSLSQSWQLSSTTSGSMTNGSNITITSIFVGSASANGSYILDVEVYNLATNTRVNQWVTTQSFMPDQSRTVVNVMTSQTGSYQVRLGVFTPNWALVTWYQQGANFNIN